MSCSHDQCPKDPRWRPALDLRSKKVDEPRRLTFQQLAYCDEHRQTLKVDAFLSPEAMTKIVKFVREAGHAAPDPRLTSLAWIPLSAKEIKALAETQQSTATDDTLAF